MDMDSTTDRYGVPVPDDDREVELDEEPKLPGPTIDPDERIELDEAEPERTAPDDDREVD
jgi:hypothetical protein